MSVEDEVEYSTAAGTAPSRAHVVSGTEGAGLGLVLIPDEGRFTAKARRLCDRFVEEGFTALVPDLPESAADPEEGARILSGAVDLLCTHDAVRGDGVGVVGFAGGANLALWLATLRPTEVAAVVPFDGLPPAGREPDWARLEASVEGHFAEGDDLVASGAVGALETRLSELGKEIRMFVYPGTSPGFFDDTRSERYDADAAHLAWVRTLEVLRAKLG